MMMIWDARIKKKKDPCWSISRAEAEGSRGDNLSPAGFLGSSSSRVPYRALRGAFRCRWPGAIISDASCVQGGMRYMRDGERKEA
jgi:hypothetical protein